MSVLVIAGAGVLLLLGLAHAIYTLQSSPAGGPMAPTDGDVRAAMAVPGALGLAPNVETTLWRAWVGFNLSHALGIVAVSLTIAIPALVDFGAALDHTGWLVLALALPPVYLLISVRYWFRGPTTGICVGIVLIAGGIVGAWLT